MKPTPNAKGPRKPLNLGIKQKPDLDVPVLMKTKLPIQSTESKMTPIISTIYQIYPTSLYPTSLNHKGVLYLSNVGTAMNKKIIDSVNIKRIVNLCVDDPGGDYTHNPDEIKIMRLKLDDLASSELAPIICATYPFIAEGLDIGENVLVHCYAGISRSVSTIMAFLILHDPEWIDTIRLKSENNVDSLYRYIKSIKSDIEPNLGFVLQLELMSDKWDVYKTKHCL